MKEKKSLENEVSNMAKKRKVRKRKSEEMNPVHVEVGKNIKNAMVHSADNKTNLLFN